MCARQTYDLSHACACHSVCNTEKNVTCEVCCSQNLFDWEASCIHKFCMSTCFSLTSSLRWTKHIVAVASKQLKGIPPAPSWSIRPPLRTTRQQQGDFVASPVRVQVRFIKLTTLLPVEHALCSRLRHEIPSNLVHPFQVRR